MREKSCIESTDFVSNYFALLPPSRTISHTSVDVLGRRPLSVPICKLPWCIH